MFVVQRRKKLKKNIAWEVKIFRLLKKMNFKSLEEKSKNLRQKTFSIYREREAHLGGSFSMIEILIYLYTLKNKKNIDKFILRGFSSFPLCILLKEKGYKVLLKTHLEIDEKNGINCTTGSLGHGLPIATGMAFARKKTKKGQIYVTISDGECQEGNDLGDITYCFKTQIKQSYHTN